LVLGVAGFASLARAEPDGNPHGRYGENCAHCHVEGQWSVLRIRKQFDHARFGFPLEGAHRTTQCSACHASLVFSEASTRCVDCHRDPHLGELGTECGRCHGTRSFVDRGPMLRAHQLTRFPLTGGHARLDCESCHAPGEQGRMEFAGTTRECRGCHMDQYRAAREPDHAQAGFSDECERCHSARAWSPSTFDHRATSFPLTGVHASQACASCHGTAQRRRVGTGCDGCHADQYAGAVPQHDPASFPIERCAECHGTATFRQASFDHSGSSFALTGAHAARPCADCHASGTYRGAATDCAGCHQRDFERAALDHRKAGFRADQCGACHAPTTFAVAAFDHSASGYALTGAHASAACLDCHGGGRFAGTSKDCMSCHAEDYRTAVPAHRADRYPVGECGTCHSTSAFRPAAFRHGDTGFALSGAHRQVPCADCHSGGEYSGAARDCYACHAQTYATASPPHLADDGFPTSQCASCHGTASWMGGRFDHLAVSTYAIDRDHRATPCLGCHVGGVYPRTPRRCSTCHPKA
jgi:Zn finger protein HypA/HybF involved in hydrogenase expression